MMDRSKRFWLAGRSTEPGRNGQVGPSRSGRSGATVAGEEPGDQGDNHKRDASRSPAPIGSTARSRQPYGENQVEVAVVRPREHVERAAEPGPREEDASVLRVELGAW